MTGERGSLTAIYVLVLTVLVISAAFIIDIGGLRIDAREAQASADFAAVAAATELDPSMGGTPYAACETAWSYFKTNAPGAQGGSSPCAPFVGSQPCDETTVPRSVVAIVDPYRVTITTPVPDGAPELEGRSDALVDGRPCERIAVVVERTRGYVFAPVINASSGAVVRSAVARGFTGSSASRGVPLVVLDPTGCRALTASGRATVLVKATATGFPGALVVDSSGTEPGGGTRGCGNSQDYAIDALGVQNSQIRAEDGVDGAGNTVRAIIYSFALTPGQGSAHSYEAADVTAGRLSPRPIPGPQVGRSPIDHRYNCRAANNCPDAPSLPPHIDDLRATVGTVGAPAGFTPYVGPCRTQPSDPPIVVAPGNWWVACTPFDVSNAVTFTSGNVVFDGTVNVGSSGSLVLNDANATDAWAYVRTGNLTKDAQASITLRRTMMYLHAGIISLGAGSGGLTWVAPTAGSFEDLALWSESPATHDLGGQTTLSIEGIFFTPNASPFRFTGQGAQYQAKAQFITYRLEVAGQGTLVMAPDPDRIAAVIRTATRLIR